VKINRRLVISSALGIVALIILIVVLVSGGDSSSSSDPGGSGSSVTTVTTTTSGSETTVDPNGEAAASNAKPFTTPNMPVTADVSSTEGLSNGSVVNVQGVPKPGSSLFGMEARLCRGGVAITNDIDFRPTMGGYCLIAPLSPGTDSHVTEAGAPPYLSVDLSFKVGTGTSTFLTQANMNTTITCDRDNPCQLVLKLQYPNGFGFQSVPVTFN